MKYVKLVIAVDEAYQESLIAELMELEFEEFQQTDDALITYIPAERFHLSDRERIEQMLASYRGEGYVKAEEMVEDQNWNAAWEKTIIAQSIGPFLVKSTWSTQTAGAGQIELHIDPKMAFGTGYHETTRLMLKLLPEIIQTGDIVLDAGTGSGILAIAAAKLGAGHVLAFDIDQWSINNVRENVHLNKVAQQITIKKGTHTIVNETARFDVILANIQQKVIVQMLPFLAQRLQENGHILLSGLLEKDEKMICDHLVKNGLHHIKTTQENEWIAIMGAK